MRARTLALLLLAATPLLFAGKKKHIAAIDDLLAAHDAAEHTVAAPGAPDPMPWAAGQWALYKRTDKKGRVSLERLAVVDRDACGFQVESVQWSEQGLTGTRICYAEMPIAG